MRTEDAARAPVARVLQPDGVADIAEQLREQAGLEEVFIISGATGEGVPALLDALLPLIGDTGAARQAFDAFDEDEDGDEPETEDKPWSPL